MNKNSLIKKTAGAVASLALVGGAVAMSGGSAIAADGDLGVQITPGSLSGTVDAVDFGATSYSLTDAAHLEIDDVPASVTDERGTMAGWTFQLTASDLQHTVLPGAKINADKVSIEAISSPVAQQGSVTAGTTGDLGTPLTVMSAADGSGNGLSTTTLDFDLEVPAMTPSGTYTGTLTMAADPLV